ncbi:MAG: TonB family protein [Erythrobacter sp.]|nr:TonB family protein [Erythrobacter sp.]
MANPKQLTLAHLVALAVALLTPNLAQAQDLPPELANKKGATKLQPIAPWNIDFGDNRCRLSRLFGDAEKPHLVMIEQAAPRSEFGLTLAGPKLRKFPMGSWTYLGVLRDVPVASLTGEQYGEVDQIGKAIIFNSIDIGQPSEADEGLGQLTRPGLDLDQAGKIDRFVLKLGSTVVSFETGNMMPALQAMNVCTNDLLASWGLSPERHALYHPAQWINRDDIAERISKDYPDSAKYRGEQGIMRMRVIVETDGSVSDCHIEASTEQDRLQSPACEKMGDAQFEPALDAQGNPIRSFHATTLFYSAYPLAR